MEVNSNQKLRKFNSKFRSKIVLKISKLTSKKDFVNIFNIIQGEVGDEISMNRNGIFININLLSDDTIDKLNEYLNENVENITATETENKIKYKPYSIDENVENSKLSNHEKSILKKINKI
jgi:hypothetical protein